MRARRVRDDVGNDEMVRLAPEGRQRDRHDTGGMK
jgi:hypothetical protein